MKALKSYAKDRDAAFCAFVEDGDFAHIDRFADKWGLKQIPHTDVGRAAVYKAVQECTHISDKVKTDAIIKCIDIGFMPWIDIEEGEQ